MDCKNCNVEMLILGAEYVCPNCLNAYNIDIEPLDNFDVCCEMKTIEVDSNKTCVKCGKSELCILYEDDYYKVSNKLSLYKRYKYFLEKLNLLSGRKMSQSEKCTKLIKILKPDDFDNVMELRRIMKKLGYSKLNKFIYNIYFEIKKDRLIDFTQKQKYKLSQDFIKIERVFKKLQVRKNIYNYNLIIGLLMEKNQIKGFEHLIMPKNKYSIKPLIDILIK